MMNKKFQRKKENFECLKCGFFVKGNGYTNHCPKCLWSRHVDINPGDRQEKCRGMMGPVAIEQKSDEYVVVQKCERCKTVKKFRASRFDDIEAILKLAVESNENK